MFTLLKTKPQGKRAKVYPELKMAQGKQNEVNSRSVASLTKPKRGPGRPRKTITKFSNPSNDAEENNNRSEKSEKPPTPMDQRSIFNYLKQSKGKEPSK